MKKTFFVLMTAVLAAFTVAAAPQAGATRFNPKPVSPRYAKVGKTPLHTLAQKGKAQCEIVLPAKSIPAVKFAAAELKSFLEKIIGSKVPVVSAPTGKGTAFLLGAYGAKSINFDLNTIDRDGFIIKSAGKNIIIAGTDDPKARPEKRLEAYERGTLNGVYEFLERFGGVRFYFPGEMGTVVPRKADWKTGSIDIADRPDSQYRRTYCVNVKALGVSNKLITPGNMKEADLKRLAAMRIRESTLHIPNCHGLRGLQLVKRYAKTKPEFFALRADGTRHDGSRVIRKDDADGQLCFTNDELKEIVYEDAKAYFTGKAATTRNISQWSRNFFSGPFFNIMPNDALYPCRCAKCVKVRRDKDPKATAAEKKQATSDHIWKFKADIARRLQKEGIPGYCTMMAYSSHKPIPSFDLCSNIVVMLAMTGPWKECNPAQAQGIELLKAWQKKLNAKTYLWTYTTKIGNGLPYVPCFTPRSVGSFFKKTAPYSFGAFLEAELDFWIFNSMNFYVFGKTLWNTDTDVDALMKEHFQLMYGPAAKEMEEFYNTIERHWVKDIMANIRETPVGPQAVLPSQFDLWNKIYGPAEIKRIEALFDRAEKVSAKDTMANKRVKFMRKELWGPVLRGMKQFHKQNNDRSAWNVYLNPVTSPVTIDGKLNEAAWKKAETIWMIPVKGDVAEVHTRVKLLSDKDYFYFGFENDEPFTDKMLCAPRKRDEINMWRDNLVEIFISDSHTSKIMYQFMLSSRGGIVDLRKSPGYLDTKWNCAMEYKAGVVPGKMWVAEVKIPRKAMPEIKGNNFVINFTRGRVLTDPKAYKVPYYAWSIFKKQQSEYCGTAIIGTRPAVKPVIRDGKFDVKVRGNRFAGAWYTNKKIFIDEKVFRSCGKSVRIESVKGSELVRQFIPKGAIKPNARYRFSYFVKLKDVKGKAGHAAAGFSTQIRFGGKGSSWFRPTKQAFQGSTDWRRLEYEFTAPADPCSIARAYIEFKISGNATGTAWVDNVEIVEIPAK